MSDTYGLTSFASSASAALQSYLASRLRARPGLGGSTLYKLPWKERATPVGRRICALRASAHRTSVNGSTGWPTPTSSCGTGAGTQGRDGGLNLQSAAALAGWPMPTTPSGGRTVPEGTTATGRQPDGSKVQVYLDTVAQLAGWATLRAEDAESAGMRHGHAGPERPDPACGLAGTGAEGADLGRTACDSREVNGPARLPVYGAMLIGSAAEMDGGGKLSPAHSRWIMGYQQGWDACGYGNAIVPQVAVAFIEAAWGCPRLKV